MTPPGTWPFPTTDKFPEGYILELSTKEIQEVVKKFDHLKSLKFSP
jgi:hypothetical protein